MGKIIFTMIGLIIAILGTIMVFDARLLDQNEATAGFKIIGFVIGIIGALVVFFNR